jgi:ribose 5-phosphate isomerase B
MEESSEIIAIGSDHAGVRMKASLVAYFESKGFHFKDYGPATEESLDYPDIAHPLSKEVDSGQISRGILLCGSGNGMAIVANRYKGIRATICWTKELAVLARQHNDANILVLPARFMSAGLRKFRKPCNRLIDE